MDVASARAVGKKMLQSGLSGLENKCSFRYDFLKSLGLFKYRYRTIIYFCPPPAKKKKKIIILYCEHRYRSSLRVEYGKRGIQDHSAFLFISGVQEGRSQEIQAVPSPGQPDAAVARL